MCKKETANAKVEVLLYSPESCLLKRLYRAGVTIHLDPSTDHNFTVRVLPKWVKTREVEPDGLPGDETVQFIVPGRADTTYPTRDEPAVVVFARHGDHGDLKSDYIELWGNASSCSWYIRKALRNEGLIS